MTNKELYYLACQCLSLDDHPDFADEIIRCLSDDSNCKNFIQVCSNHWILPAIHLKFKAHGILSQLSEELVEFLEEVFQLNYERNERILKQLQEIIQLFNEHEIFPTLLKGTGNLLDQLYSNMGERMMGDIDILVAEKDYLPAAHLLENNGYFHNSPSFFEVKDMKHYPRLHKKGAPADVEIHRIPVRTEYTKMYNSPIIDQEKKNFNEGFSCFILSDKHKVIHNFIHTQLSNNGHKYGVVPVRDLFDLYLLSKRINISQTLPHIQHKRKAVTYFLYANKAFNQPDMFNQKANLTYKIFCIKNELCFKSFAFYRTNKSLVYLSDRIYKYIDQIIKSIYSADMRKSLFKRISNRQWYENHKNTYINFFSSKK
jgi:hypothetical protein